MSHPRPQPRAVTPGGFTLVELLMVILIIGMLMALLLPAIMAARRTARNAQLKTDIDQLANHLTEFHKKYGGYPPDASWTDQEIATFIRRAFPRITQPNLNLGVATVRNLTYAEALVFWLGGYWDGNKMIGFSLDPTTPFQIPDPNNPPAPNHPSHQRVKVAEFQETRLYNAGGRSIQVQVVDNSGNSRLVDWQARGPGFPEFYPPGVNPEESAPYVYFGARPRSAGQYLVGTTANHGAYSHPNIQGVAVPYRYNVPPTPPNANVFAEPEKFQIICAGIDGDYGANDVKYFRHGANYGPGDEDNLVSFSDRTLGDARP